MKIDKKDRLFSLLVRERANWKCECCGKQYERGAQGLHCSHFVSRRYRGLRWHPQNAAAHCFGCHQRLGGNPLDFAEWIKNHVGEKTYDWLLRRKNEICKLRAADLLKIQRALSWSLTVMQRKRDQGDEHRIEFDSPYPSDLERREAAAREAA